MPTIAVDRDRFLSDLGSHKSTDEFDELCFEYGLELDEDTSLTTPEELPHQLKIEVPANRYDLLCYEGILRALRIFLEREKPPIYKIIPPREDRWVEILPETQQIRPYFATAILRNINFTPERYASFIELQDKLHQNLARKRTLVAIGTHDLDRVALGRISYEARKPQDIKFAPLNRDEIYTADKLMELYESDKHIGRYLHIIRDSPVYPIIYDSTQQVLSMPPIINSQHTKITLNTQNVFIDVTATDRTKLNMVLNMVVTMFAQYTADPFTVEQVRNTYPDGSITITPDLSPTVFTAHLTYINSCTGLDLPQSDIIRYLERMGHDVEAAQSRTVSDRIIVSVPPTRPDILHECDLMEDVAVAYGFNNLKKTFPSSNTVARPLPINKLSDIIRNECALSGFIEVLPLILCSFDENFAWLNRENDGKTAIVLENPKTAEYQIVRTSLLPGLLKSLRENRKQSLPIRIFEVSDVAIKDDSMERRARNIRKMAAVYCGRKAGFEIVHGLLDRLMLMLDVENIKNKAGSAASEKAGYYIEHHDDATFFPDRAAKIFYRPARNPSAQPTNLLDAGPSASNDIPSFPAATAPTKTVFDTETPTERPSHPRQPSVLDTLKEKLLSSLPTLDGKAAQTQQDIEIGIMGIVHPLVLRNFELEYPCSALEFTLEHL